MGKSTYRPLNTKYQSNQRKVSRPTMTITASSPEPNDPGPNDGEAPPAPQPQPAATPGRITPHNHRTNQPTNKKKGGHRPKKEGKITKESNTCRPRATSPWG